MISGECRVDTIPFGNPPSPSAKRKLAIDGLRLQLDLRIVPSAAGDDDAAAAAVWRIENARLASEPLGSLAWYRKFAVAAGLGAMLLALGMWFAQPPGAPPTTTRESSRAPAVGRVATPAATAPAPLQAAPPQSASTSPPQGASTLPSKPASGVASSSAAGTRGQAAPVVPGVAPPIAATPGDAAPAALEPRRLAARAAPPAERAAPARSPRSIQTEPHPSAAATRAGSESSSTASGQPVAATPGAAAGSRGPAVTAANLPAPTGRAPDDMLDLFGDTK